MKAVPIILGFALFWSLSVGAYAANKAGNPELVRFDQVPASKSLFYGINFGQLSNHKLDWLLNAPQGRCVYGGVPFNLESSVISTDDKIPTIKLSADVPGATKINLLLTGNSINRERKDTRVGDVCLQYSDAAPFL